MKVIVFVEWGNECNFQFPIVYCGAQFDPKIIANSVSRILTIKIIEDAPIYDMTTSTSNEYKSYFVFFLPKS